MENIFTEEYLKSLGDIEITQLPYALNPDKMLYEEIMRRYAEVCPHCNKKIKWQFPICQTSFRHCGKWWQFWNTHYCKRVNITCDNCRTEWYTPWFPQDLTEKELKKIKKRN